jgi:hypothetical protein
MARRPAKVRMIKRTIKLSLHPVHEQHLIELIDAAPHKGRLVIDALEGRQQVPAPTPVNADDELHEQLSEFLM